jgi:deoxyadenosine/deoxycytidine kinase
MEHVTGKIIAITGGPRSGKSTLVKMLAEHLEGKAFLEGEEKDFPKRIIDDIVNEDKPLELMLWFRNHAVKQYLEAMKIKNNGGTAVLDCFWLTNQPYIDLWVPDMFEKELLTEVSKLDIASFPWPDTVIVLTQDTEGIKEFSKRGERKFEDNNDYFSKQIAIHERHDNFFKEIKSNYPEVIFFDRSGLDFINSKDDFNKFLNIFIK